MYNTDRLDISEADMLALAQEVDAARALIEHSTDYLRYVASHVGHPTLAGELGERAESWAQGREDLTELLTGIANSMVNMVRAFVSSDAELGSQVPAGSADSLERQHLNSFDMVTGVHLDVS